MAYPYDNQWQGVQGIGGASFGAVPGVVQASSMGSNLQANNTYGGATIQVPGKPQSTSTALADTAQPQQQQQAYVPQNGGGGQAANPYSAYIPAASFLGKNYDLSDAGQRMAYFNDQHQNLQNKYQQTISDLKRTYDQNLGDAGISNQQNLGALRQNQYNVYNNQGTGQADQYARGLTKSIADLYNGYGTGLANSHSAYMALSPDAFQSSEAQDANFAQSQYNKGNADLQSTAQRTVGSHFLQDGTLDPNSELGQQYAGYGRDIGNLQRQYDQYLGDQKNSLAHAYQSANSENGSAQDAIASQLGTYDKFQKNPIQGYGVSTSYQGVDPNFSAKPADLGAGFAPGSVQTYKPYDLPNVNISQYSPFASSGQLAGSPGSSFNGQGVGGGNPTGLPQQTPLQQGLGYTPGSVQASYAQQYLKGGAVVANQ